MKHFKKQTEVMSKPPNCSDINSNYLHRLIRNLEIKEELEEEINY